MLLKQLQGKDTLDWGGGHGGLKGFRNSLIGIGHWEYTGFS